MKSRSLIAVTQRVVTVHEHSERRDALDQRWSEFLAVAGYVPLILPNQPELALALITELRPRGLVLTGGNSLAEYGGDAPERDVCEKILLQSALDQGLPVLGVCRGMQLLLSYYGQILQPVSGQIRPQQTINFRQERIEVNSFHNWGCYDVPEAFTILGRSDEGIIKAIAVEHQPVLGIMWHPERLSPFSKRDIELFKGFFGGVE